MSQPAAALAFALVVTTALPGCQFLGASEASRAAPAAGFDQIGEPPADQAEPAASGYPSLHSVPPRPRLSYSVQQRRAILDGLVADRENARYTDQLVRYRTGQSSLPPPPAPPTTVAAVVPDGLLGPGEPEAEPEEAVDPEPTFDDDEDAFDRQYDEDTLGDFVNELARETDPEEEEAEDELDGSASGGASEEGSGWRGWLGRLFGRAETDAADPAATKGEQVRAAWLEEAAPPVRPPVDQAETLSQATSPDLARDLPRRPEPAAVGVAVGAGGIAIDQDDATVEAAPPDAPPPASQDIVAPPAPDAARPEILVRFEPGSAALPPDVGARLEQVLATAKAQGSVIRILGEAHAPALALDRARAVALGLMRVGASARDLEMALAPGATGDQARLVLAGPAAR